MTPNRTSTSRSLRKPGIAAGFCLGIFLLGLCAVSPLWAEDIAYDDGKRRDPFIPLLGNPGMLQYAAAPADANVGGIIYDPSGGSIVVLNGESYREGDQTGNLTVISILKDRVILKQDDKEKTLWIREEVADDMGSNETGKQHETERP